MCACVKGGGVEEWRCGGEGKRDGHLPHYPRRAAGDFANSTWPEAMNTNTQHYSSFKELPIIPILCSTRHFVGKGRLISDGPVQFSCTNWFSRDDPQ